MIDKERFASFIALFRLARDKKVIILYNRKKNICHEFRYLYSHPKAGGGQQHFYYKTGTNLDYPLEAVLDMSVYDIYHHGHVILNKSKSTIDISDMFMIMKTLKNGKAPYSLVEKYSK